MAKVIITEAEVLHGIMDYLHLRHVFCWRNNSGAFKVGDRYIRSGLKGSPDILGIMPDGSGRILCIEVKRPGGKPTPEQVAFLARVRELGGVAIIAYSLNDVITAIE